MTACRYESGRYPRNVHLLGTVPVEAVGARATPTYRTLLLLILNKRHKIKICPLQEQLFYIKYIHPQKCYQKVDAATLKKRRLAIKHTIVRLNADTTRIHTCQRTSFYFRVTLYVKIHFTCCYRTQTPILHKLIFKLCLYKKRIHYFILAYYSLVWQHRFASGQPSRQLRLCSVSTPPHTSPCFTQYTF